MNSEKHINDDLRKKESENLKLRTIMEMSEELSGIGSFEFDAKTGNITVSDGWMSIHGVNKRSLIMDELVELAHIDDLDMILKSIDYAITESGIYDIEHRIIRQTDRKIRTIRARGKVIYDNKGLPGKMYGSVQDITEQKIAENKLKESEEKFKSIIHFSPVGVGIVDKKGNLLDCNDALADIIGYKKDELMGVNFAEFTHPHDLQKEWELIKQVWENKADKYELEKRYITKSKNIVWVKLVGTVSRDEQGNIKFGFAFVEDITEKKKAEEQLKKSEEKHRELSKTKDRFFSIISHDLKSPILGFMRITESFVNNFHTIRIFEMSDMLKSINESSTVLYKMLNNLLIWSEFNQDKIKYAPERINLTKIADETISLMKTEIKQKEIDCRNDIPGDLVAYSDENMTSIIFRNLLSNAIKFTEKKGKICINISINSDNFAEIEISDNGKGISEDRLSNLFDLDKYYSQQGTEGEKGSGIGLILCKEFVEKQGGKIWVESQHGEGSKFFFTLPLQEME